MAKGVMFSPVAWDEYLQWTEDAIAFNKINTLINDCRRDPFKGLGKPEPLKHEYKGYWSRRVSDKHRLIYGVTNEHILIVRCTGHYDDK
jgi:toxin YoeB